MEKSYIPKVTEKELCEGINLCSVRKTTDGITKIGIKDLAGNISEETLENIINSNTYNSKEIIRVYSSGHVFLNDDKKEVFLVTTEKEGKVQIQFTGGSPLEEENKEVIFKEEGVYKFDLEKVRKNAEIRTKKRTGVDVTENYNKKPIVDWVLIESEDNYKLVCLMHFIVKKYEGDLGFTGNENTVGGQFYNIDDLQEIKNIAPNAYIVSKEVLKYIK